MATSYTEKDVKIFKGLEAVRHKPGMYIGETGSGGLAQIIKEIIDNCLDEALAGRNKFVGLSFEKDGSICVWDRGGGVPVGKHKDTGKSTLISVFGTLHAGAKMNAKDKAYEASVGTHGVGSAATNALSEYFDVATFRDGKWYSVRFKKGVLKSDLKKISTPKTPDKKKAKCGTIVRFKPDLSCFDKNAKLNTKKIVAALEVSSYLYPTVTFVVVDNITGKKKIYHQPNGYKALLEKKREALKAELSGKPFIYSSKNLNIVVQWSDHTEEAVSSYVNGSPTSEGGTHVKGFFAALNDALKPYKGKRADFTPDDLRAGLIGVLNYKLAAPSFDSQTKENRHAPQPTRR